jgi:valyl-tRNA synthetase
MDEDLRALDDEHPRLVHLAPALVGSSHSGLAPLDLIHGATFDEVVDKALPGAPKEEALKKFKKAYPSVATMGSGFATYGADALRFTLATYSPQSKRIPLSPKKLEGNRNFCNKIRNATRYALGYPEGANVGATPPRATLLPNRWILSRLAAATATARAGIDNFRLDDAALGLYHFFWGEHCDWYLEITKPIFAAGGDAAAETRDVLAYVLEAVLRLLHPFVPFITEELWHMMPRPSGAPIAIALAAYPDEKTAARDAEAERDMASCRRRSARPAASAPSTSSHEATICPSSCEPATRACASSSARRATRSASSSTPRAIRSSRTAAPPDRRAP